MGTASHAGAALSGVTVTATGGNISTTATDTTDSLGKYDLGWLPTGSYTVTGSKQGFTTQNVTFTLAAGSTAPIDCNAL